MSQVVGFYKSKDEAKRICDELVAAGFDRDDVRVFSPENTSSSAAASTHDTGFWQSVKDFFSGADESDHQLYAEAARRGSVGVSVDADTDAEEQKAADILRRGSAIDLDRESTEWRKSGWTGGMGSTSTSTTAGTAARTGTTAGTAAARTTTGTTGAATTQNLQQGKEVIPVAEEHLQVGKRQVQGGGVRIHSRVTSKPVQEQVTLREEHVDVQRRPVDRPLTDADKAFRDRNIEVTETREQPVVSKDARVVEEVVVGKTAQQRTETVRDQVRRTDVDVERTGGISGTPGSTASSTTGFSDPDAFARELAADNRYRGRDWTTVSSDAQRTFEQRYPGSKWDQFKDAIQRGYEKVRQKV